MGSVSLVVGKVDVFALFLRGAVYEGWSERDNSRFFVCSSLRVDIVCLGRWCCGIVSCMICMCCVVVCVGGVM